MGMFDRDEMLDTKEEIIDQYEGALTYLASFEYVGGGYYRKKGVAKGKSAEMLHGAEILQVVEKALEPID